MMRTPVDAPFGVPSWLVAGAAVAGSVAAGTVMVHSIQLGVALAAALSYAPVVLLNLPLGVVLWIPTVSLIAVAALDVGPNLAGILITFAWLGAFAARSSGIPAVVAEHRRIIAAVAVTAGWVLVSMAWAVTPLVGSDVFFGWLVTVVIVLVVSTTLTDRRHLRWAAAAFVAGALVSVALGFAGGTVKPSATEAARVVGGSGDPNFLAAGLVPAVVLTVGLAAGTRQPAFRLLAAPVVSFLLIGLVASQSRGGLVAVLVAGLAALVLAGRRRGWVLLGLLWVAGAGAAWWVADPASWERLADFEQSNGRSELFEVAWRMWQDHPVVGVGLGDFRVHSSEYAHVLGPLEFAEFLTEERKYVHNVYLEILAETGIVGLLLFTTVLALCLRAAWRAVRLFRQAGDPAMATLAKAVVIGVVAWLAAGMFISGQTDRRLWLLLALGPAMLAAAKRQAGAYAVEGSRARPRRMGYARRHTP